MIEQILKVGFTVSDLEQSLAFYTQVLPFEQVGEIVEVYGPEYEALHGLFGLRMRVANLRLGSEIVELTEYLTPAGRPIPPDSRSNDGWFQHLAIVVSDMEAAYSHLRQYKVKHVSTAPQTLPDWNKAAAGIQAFYFRDPDGHNLEIIHFPAGKGQPRWQSKDKDKLFLGIDHTAIAVSSTTASLKFYQDLLGLGLVGSSLNYGEEQAHLNQVKGAKLQINSLGAKEGPGVEFLEYLQPRTGRPFPADTIASDLWHWQTTLTTPNLPVAAVALWEAGYQLISPGVVELPDARLGFIHGFMVRDPDGHALRIVAG
jgi:catechol 2,3-dioxygenase-like lactoylglutathione lyase family enzyme